MKMANTGNKNPGSDWDKTNEAGKKGGQASGGQPSRDSDRMSGGGQGNRGGEFADDKENMSKPGQRGGQASGGQQANRADQSSNTGQGSGRDSNLDRDQTDKGRNDGGMSGGGGRKP
jgi:general stress protein YciG